MKPFKFIILLAILSCKENSNFIVNDLNHTTLDFDLNNNVFPVDDAIKEIKYTEIKSDKLFSVRDDGYEIIKYQNNKIYAGNKAENELVIIDSVGYIVNTIVTYKPDITAPSRIRDFTLSNENLIIFEQSTNKLYFYSLYGDFLRVESDPDSTTIFNSFAFLQPNHLVFQKYHDRLDFAVKRKNTLVGKVWDLETKELRPIYYNGGSETRDKLISRRFNEINEGVLFNYWLSKELFLIKKTTDNLILTMESPQLINSKVLEKIDNSNPEKGVELASTEFHKNGKIDNLHFCHMHEDIFFMTMAFNKKLHWVFYNSKKNQYKVIKFQPLTVYSHNGISFWPYVKNAKDNYFMVMLDGQAMQDTEKIKFDKNKAYFIKIYPKYLNQEAWE